MVEKKTRHIEMYKQTGLKMRNEGISKYDSVKMQKLRSCRVQMKSIFENTEK
jgi:hypothetical protein